MALASSPISLKRKSQCTENSSSYPTTPIAKTSDRTMESLLLNDRTPETPQPRIRERRGRRNNTNISFRPLTVFTQSLLIPFDLDIEKGFEILKGDSPDRLEEAGRAIGSSHKRLKMTQALQTERTSFSSKGLSSSPSSSTTDPFESPRDGEMDLMTALKETSPEKDVAQNLCADFAILCELPAPQPSQHPTFSTDPFKLISEAPFLTTYTPVSEIKSHNPTVRTSGEVGIRPRQDSLDKKRSLFGLEFRTPASARSRNAFSTPEDGQPLSSFSTNSPTSSPAKPSSLPSSSDPLSSKPNTGSSSGSSIRKFSNRFKRTNSEQSESIWYPWSPVNSTDSPNLNRQDLERYVRRTTNTPTYDYDPASPYPRHPNTGRGWKSRNLKCTNCIERCCACCGRACCAYRAAVLALEIRPEGTASRAIALHRIQEITKLYPYGKEVPTFLQCTAGLVGDGMGCGKLVCPDCCSICPDQACGDTQCRRCKSGMWEECTWHKGISFV